MKLRYQTKALQFYRRRNDSLALAKEFEGQEPSIEEGRTLIDGRSLDSDGNVIEVPQP